MKIIKNKKADAVLDEGLLKLIIAIAVIVLLIILASKMYSIFVKKSEIEKARATLDQIVSKINALKTSSEGATQSLIVLSPKTWAIKIMTGAESGGKCISAKCLCICDFSMVDSVYDAKIQCSANGVCKDLEVPVISDLSCKKSKLLSSDLVFEKCKEIKEAFDLYFVKEGESVRLK